MDRRDFEHIFFVWTEQFYVYCPEECLLAKVYGPADTINKKNYLFFGIDATRDSSRNA